MNKTGKGQFQKGKSGNPKGRPRSKQRELLEKALETVEKRKKLKFWIHFCELAYEDNTVAVALARKLVADRKQVDMDVEETPTPIINVKIQKTYKPEPKAEHGP